jgi:hypothetical protein
VRQGCLNGSLVANFPYLSKQNAFANVVIFPPKTAPFFCLFSKKVHFVDKK